jgi:hypothetical protein
MISEKTFAAYLNTISCRGCDFFVDEKCTEKDFKMHNIDKEELRMTFYNEGVKGLMDMKGEKEDSSSEARREMLLKWIDISKDIESTFVCEEFKNDSRES